MTFTFKEGNDIPYIKGCVGYQGIPAGKYQVKHFHETAFNGTCLWIENDDIGNLYVFINDINECCRRFK